MKGFCVYLATVSCLTLPGPESHIKPSSSHEDLGSRVTPSLEEFDLMEGKIDALRTRFRHKEAWPHGVGVLFGGRQVMQLTLVRGFQDSSGPRIEHIVWEFSRESWRANRDVLKRVFKEELGFTEF